MPPGEPAPAAAPAAATWAAPEPVRMGVPVVGAHGGSGATTVAGYLGSAQPSLTGGVGVFDAGTKLPSAIVGPALIVTARGTAAGAAAAQRMIGAVAGSGGTEPLPVVVVVTSDGPWPLPPVVRARLRAMSGRVHAVVRLPYVPRWRFIDLPTEPPGRYLTQMKRVCDAINACTSGSR